MHTALPPVALRSRRPLRAAVLAGLACFVAMNALPATDTPPVIVSDEQLFNWAEQTYSSFFPGPSLTQTWQSFQYRYYPLTGNYVGVSEGGVYILGPVAGNQSAQAPKYVGELADFTCAVLPSSCIDSRSPGNRFGIRRVGGRPVLYDRVSGADFLPRGHNFVRLAPMKRFDGSMQTYHSNFSVGLYDKSATGAALEQMSAWGYNTVRVFLSVCCVGTLSDTGSKLNVGYVSNLAHFIGLAKQYGIAVLLTSDAWLPNGYPESATIADRAFELENFIFFSRAGVDGTRKFWRDLILNLRIAGAPLDNVLAYSVANEAYADGSAAPFVALGPVVAANGRRYELNNKDQREALVKEGLVYFADQVRQAIRAVDPTALVTMGFFPANEPHVFMPGDPRIVPRIFPAFNSSTLDFIDLHPYPAFRITFSQIAENFGIDAEVSKLLIMGEFGELRADALNQTIAATHLALWRKESCAYRFKGWLLWTWDTTEQDDGRWWTATDANGAIRRDLSPRAQPEVCP